MNRLEEADPRLAGRNWIVWVVNASIFLYAAARKLANNYGEPSFVPALLLLEAFLLLYLSQPWISRRQPRYLPAYFIIQMGIILALAVQLPYEDTWAVLFIPMAFQAMQSCPRRLALAWIAAFTACMLLSLMAIFGLWLGLGYSLNYFAGGFLLLSFHLYYSQVEANQRESQELLSELGLASRRLEAYAAQAEEQAALLERDRLTRELHDSVSQTLFSISLTAQSARMLIEKDPQRVPELLDRLQEMTGGALYQMRALITKLRERQGSREQAASPPAVKPVDHIQADAD
jgi:signal transduction histidine kinase